MLDQLTSHLLHLPYLASSVAFDITLYVELSKIGPPHIASQASYVRSVTGLLTKTVAYLLENGIKPAALPRVELATSLFIFFFFFFFHRGVVVQTHKTPRAHSLGASFIRVPLVHTYFIKHGINVPSTGRCESLLVLG